MRTVNDKHSAFVKSLRNIMKIEDKKRADPLQRNSDKENDEETQRLQELLEAKFDELFGPIDTNDD